MTHTLRFYVLYDAALLKLARSVPIPVWLRVPAVVDGAVASMTRLSHAARGGHVGSV